MYESYAKKLVEETLVKELASCSKRIAQKLDQQKRSRSKGKNSIRRRETAVVEEEEE